MLAGSLPAPSDLTIWHIAEENIYCVRWKHADRQFLPSQ